MHQHFNLEKQKFKSGIQSQTCQKENKTRNKKTPHHMDSKRVLNIQEKTFKQDNYPKFDHTHSWNTRQPLNIQERIFSH